MRTSNAKNAREALHAIEHAARSVESTAARVAESDDPMDASTQDMLGQALASLDEAKASYRAQLVAAGALSPPS
jgi:hypothetical protein